MRRVIIAALSVVLLLTVVAASLLGALAGHAIVASLLAFAALAGLAAASRGRLRDGLLVVCSLVFGLAVVQAALALIAPKGAAKDGNDGMVHARDIFGWGPTRPGTYHLTKRRPDGAAIYDVHATIDPHLNRRTVPSDGKRPIAFFGDSFVFGDGLNDAETLPQAFADLEGGRIPVLNLGFSGWAPSQNLAGLQRGAYRDVLGASRHVFLFTAAFHVQRTACKGDFAYGSGPRYVLHDGALEAAGLCKNAPSATWTRAIARLLGLGRMVAPDPLTRRDVETYLSIIETFVATARRDLGAATTLIVGPNDDEQVAGTGYTSAAVIEALRAAGVDIVVPELPQGADPALYKISGDGHPTGLANRVLARHLEAHLRQVDPAALAETPEDVRARRGE